MFLTNVLLKAPKSKHVLVQVQSVCSGHKMNMVRERAAEKLEVLWYDPKIDMECIFKEVKKYHGVRIKDKTKGTPSTLDLDVPL